METRDQLCSGVGAVYLRFTAVSYPPEDLQQLVWRPPVVRFTAVSYPPEDLQQLVRRPAVVARLREQLLQGTVERDLDIPGGLGGALADEPVTGPRRRRRL